MFWSKKEKVKTVSSETVAKQMSSCCQIQACPRCGCPIEGLALVCPRCREELSLGCSGKCSGCGK